MAPTTLMEPGVSASATAATDPMTDPELRAGGGDDTEIVLLMGPPGAGKGTQATALAQARDLTPLSTGDMLRDHARRGTELGVRANAIMDAGELVPDDAIIGMVRETLAHAPRLRFLLDGFPRTTAQAAALDALLDEHGTRITAAVAIEVDDEPLVQRLLRRAELEGRSDDNEQTVRNRMAVYRRQTAPLLEYYAGRGVLRTVDGLGSVDEVQARIREVLP
jgi:adenylate kinase